VTTVATARVWLSVAGVAAGIFYAHHDLPSRGAVGCIALGVGSVGARRGRAVGMCGILLLAAGLSALRPVSPDDGLTVWGGAVADTYRESLASALQGATERPRALLAGLTIGDTSNIDYWTTEMFRRSGLAHLVAVSGSNVAMVLAAIAILTVRRPLVLRGTIGAIGLVAYVAVVGPEPSVLRAAGMGLVGLIAYVCGRQATSLNALGIALVAVLTFKPELLFSVGLHLSAAATLGIVVWAQPIERRLARLPRIVSGPMSITLAAQIGVAPLLIVAFEQLSLVAPLANLLAAPAVAPATLIGLSSGVVSLAWPVGGRALGAVAAPFAEWILWVSDTTGAWPSASVDIASVWGWAAAVPVVLLTLRAAVRPAPAAG